LAAAIVATGAALPPVALLAALPAAEVADEAPDPAALVALAAREEAALAADEAEA
jgi:hypothetical protein